MSGRGPRGVVGTLALVLIGPHGAGKTTLGTELARGLGVPFHEEIGRRLAEQVGRDRRPEISQPAFDAAVLAAERARDAAWRGGLRVVETWHVGNLAYARARSPAIADRYLRFSLRRAVCIFVDAEDAVLDARQSECGPASFFRGVGRQSVNIARELGVPVLGRIDGAQNIQMSVAWCIERLPSYLKEVSL